MCFSCFMSSLFLHHYRHFLIKRQNSQNVRIFHKNKLVHIIWWEEYLLNMRFKRRTCMIENFVWSIFLNCRRRSRARFDENEWTFKTYNDTILYVSDQIFYTWNLLYINKSSDERSSFTVVDHVEFIKLSRSWTFARRQKKRFLNTSLLFCDSTLRSSDVKTASRLTHIGLAYHASWEMRVAYPRLGEHLGTWGPEYWGK
jgi:hypothetical protein